MLKDAIEAVRAEHGLKPVKETIHGVEHLLIPYRDADGAQWRREALEAPHKLPVPLQVATLTAVVEYVTSKVDREIGAPAPAPADDVREALRAHEAKLIVHVKGADMVEVLSPILPGAFAQRATLVRATIENAIAGNGFALGTKTDYETFIIALQSRFDPNLGERDELLRFLGAVRSEKLVETTDTGYSQKVLVRDGITTIAPEAADVPNPVELAPFRTFREVEQPISQFVFRLFDGPEGSGKPVCALYEADGGTWRIEAIKRIADFLRDQLAGVTEVTVIA